MITTVFLSIGLTIIERIVEPAWVSEIWRGVWSAVVESGRGHWPWMVTLHTVFLGAMVAEALFAPTISSFPMTVASVIRPSPPRACGGGVFERWAHAGTPRGRSPRFAAHRGRPLSLLQPPQLHRCRCRRHRPADDSWMLEDCRWVHGPECPLMVVRIRCENAASSSGVLMTDAQILETLSQLVRDKLKVDAPLDGELADHLDSIQRLTLVVAIEDHFEICFDESDEAEITGLDDLVRAIRSKLSED